MNIRFTRIFPAVFAVIAFACFYGEPSALAKKRSEPAQILKQADQCRHALNKSPNKMKYRHNWERCIRGYESIYKNYPTSDPAGWALYHSGRLFRALYAYSGRSEDLDQALLLFRRLADDYKDHRLADDAQFLIGDVFYQEKNDPAHAYVEYLKVDIKFPSGDMRPKARKMLDALAVTLSKKENDAETRGPLSEKSGLAAVKEIRHWSTPNYTRVVVDLDTSIKYNHHLLKADPALQKPRRLYLDLMNAQVTSELESAVPIKDGLLQRARAAQYEKDTVRVVLDIESLGGYKIFHLHDPFRIVVDVRRSEKAQAPDASEVATPKRAVGRGVRKAEAPKPSVSLARQLGLNVKRIVIDPGHGGKDPGCNSQGGVKEKDIVLNIAEILAARIEAEIGCEVFLTRNKDVFLPLERRTAIANIKKADLFISLHVNAHRNKNIWGLETYFLNMATDERSVMVAARENATSEKNISDLQAILNDLMLNTKINESSRLAYAVQKGMLAKVQGKYKQVRDLGVKQAPFYVLIGAEMPAILVETGFLTNRRDRNRLRSKAYREALADGICDGLRTYMESIYQAYKGG